VCIDAALIHSECALVLADPDAGLEQSCMVKLAHGLQLQTITTSTIMFLKDKYWTIGATAR
jgi:hypothetical protein